MGNDLASTPITTENANNSALSQVNTFLDSFSLEVDYRSLTQLYNDLRFLPPEELELLWGSYSQELSATPSSTLVANMILTEWSRKDGENAVMQLLNEETSDIFRQQAFPLMMESWVINQPLEVDKWYFASEQQGLREDISLSIGENAARELFTWQGLESNTNYYSRLDSLSDPIEIFGAIEGLKLSVYSEFSTDEIREALSLNTGNSDSITTVYDLGLAYEEIYEDIRDTSDTLAVPWSNLNDLEPVSQYSTFTFEDFLKTMLNSP
jgi:hypothetical protein